MSTKIIEINSCKECPYLTWSKKMYCSKIKKSKEYNYDEIDENLEEMFLNCPLTNIQDFFDYI